MNRRKSALAVIAAAVAVCSMWAGLVAAPASATELPTLADGDVAESVTVSVSAASARSITGEAGAAPAEVITRTHNWYYRIYLRGSGQTLFRWTFSTEYTFLRDRYFATMLPTDSVVLWHDSIRGNTVRYKIVATPRLTAGPLSVIYDGAEFQFCPNGTCRQTFRPRLAWIYWLDDTRTYAGTVPLE